MKSFSASSSVVAFFIAFIAFAVGGCSSSSDDTAGTSQGADPTSPTGGTTPDTFCARKCIADDRERCLAFSGRFSDAFLAAFEACGDDPACLQPKLDAAPRTARQEQLAADYCARCAGSVGGDDAATCATKFFAKGGAGSSLTSFSDARLDAVDEKCLPGLKAGLACELGFRTCVLPLLQEGLGATLVCRARR